jgi:hypothetical protein
MILHAILYTTIMFTEITSHKLHKNIIVHTYIHCMYHEFLMSYVKLMSIVNKQLHLTTYNSTLSLTPIILKPKDYPLHL